ncbi:MAG: hypothetical protein SGPRY_013069 [Prymnesium sp.]
MRGDWSAIDAALEKERRSMNMNVVGCSSSGNAIFNILFHRAQAKQASVDEAERPGSSSDSRRRAHRVLEKRYQLSFRTSSGFELGSTNCRRALVAERRR